MDICFKCHTDLEPNGAYMSITFPDVIEGIIAGELCKRCTNQVYLFIMGRTEKEECPSCGKDDEGYAQGECECGLMNK